MQPYARLWARGVHGDTRVIYFVHRFNPLGNGVFGLIAGVRHSDVGSFVYHHHTFEHEDGGMMAKIAVLCPPGVTSCALLQTVHAPICHTPAG